MDKRKIIKTVALLLCIFSVTALLAGCFGDKNKDKDNKAVIFEEKNNKVDENIQNTDVSTIDSSEFTEELGGNPYENNNVSIKVNLSENDYIYENKKIVFDELIDTIQGLGENYTVEVYDDDASEKAYQSLIDKLNELNIDYTEIENK